MCGIFGAVVGGANTLSPELLSDITARLFRLSESRGKEAAGLALRFEEQLLVYKRPFSASRLIKTPGYREAFAPLRAHWEKNRLLKSPVAVCGHSRLATNGAAELNRNNQPVADGADALFHNGIVTNDAALWRAHPELVRRLEVDTECLLWLLRHYRRKTGSSALAAAEVFSRLEGSASIALLSGAESDVLLATNTGSLYVCSDARSKITVFASESYILGELLKNPGVKNLFELPCVRPIRAGQGCLIGPDGACEIFELARAAALRPRAAGAPRTSSLQLLSDEEERPEDPVFSVPPVFTAPTSEIEKLMATPPAVDGLRRCTRCILPETMPFITFDEQGVCNYCHDYRKQELKGPRALEKEIEKYRSRDGRPDCLVPFSGGRDSSFGLHYIKTVLKMNPVAYSYDWGMITDLGRRCQALMCGKLGVEHIIVSADIRAKRKNIRKNVLAWLRQPDLGMIPLFMAGDKQYLYHANKLARLYNLKLIVLCDNALEFTHFKHGFCGVEHRLDDRVPYFISLGEKFRIAAYYGWRYLKNPAYLNRSVFDTLDAFKSFYLIPHDYLHIFRYIPWDEKQILDTIVGKYNWELASDTKLTWRIDDATAAFYNYIYLTMAGLTENDTFRSKQVREGMITRQQALELAREENRPRPEAVRWYCETIRIDPVTTLRTINAAPKLYAPA